MESLGIIGAIAAVASTAVGTYAAVSAQSNVADAAKIEAQQRQQEADSVRQSAAYEETQFRRRAALLLGKQEAIFGASGVDPGSGSPLFMELDSVRQAEIEALNIRRTGALTASSREFEARLAGFKSDTFRSQIPGTILGGLASGVGSGLSSWSRYSRNINAVAGGNV
jgi:hypothetical protein